MSAILHDLRFAFRSLRKSPGFSLAAVGTLALGIGATTAIFSTVNAALLRPLPYPHPGNLYALRTALTDGRVTTGLLSPSELVRLNAPDLSIERAVGLIAQNVTLLRDDDAPVTAEVFGVSEGFFELFGLPMSVGPGFTPEQFSADGPPVAVISHRVWQDLYGGAPDVVGKPIRFAEFSTTVAGVAPQGFDTPHGADFWLNIRLNPQGVGHSFEGFMRIRDGASLERVESEMAGVMAGLARDFPASAQNRVYVVRPLVESIVGDLGPILIVVLSATALLLALACVNVTNLLLARGAARAREMAVRIALGAGRRRIARQLLTESAVLATTGAVVGVLLAYVGVRLLSAAGASTLPRLDAVTFDANVLLFALLALVASGLVVGFAPAIRLAATDVRTLLNESGRSASGGRGTARWLGAMTVAEIALAVTLVAGAGWLIGSFASLRATDPGFVAERRLYFDTSLFGERYQNPGVVVAGWRELRDRLRAIPGVEAVGSTSNLPLRSGPENSLFVELRGEPMNPENPYGARQRTVSPGFFDAMGIRLVAGRDVSEDDGPEAVRVAVVNETFVRRYLAGRDPIGVRFSSGYPTINPESESTIVGIVADVRQKSIDEPAEPAFYSAIGQAPGRRHVMVLRTAAMGDAALQGPIRAAVSGFDPQIATDVRPLSALVESGISRQRLGMTLMLVFGVAAVVLAAVGIYGVVAYAATQRVGEMATRLALGATPWTVFWLVLRQGRILVVVGAALGLAAAYAAGRLIASRVYEISTTDPAVLGGAVAVVALIAIAATTIPAIRAARLDPSRVLRPE
jgi:predicted permease